MRVAPFTKGSVCILRLFETKHLWPGGQPPDHGSSVSTPEECTSTNPPTKMKNTVFPRSMSRRRLSHRSFRSTVAHCQGGFFNLRALLGLTLCFLGLALGIFAARESLLRRVSEPPRYMPVPDGNLQGEAAGLAQLEQYWHDRLTYPTGRFDPAWVRAAAAQHARMTSGVPAGQHLKLNLANPNALSTDQFYRTRSATGANDRLFWLF